MTSLSLTSMFHHPSANHIGSSFIVYLESNDFSALLLLLPWSKSASTFTWIIGVASCLVSLFPPLFPPTFCSQLQQPEKSFKELSDRVTPLLKTLRWLPLTSLPTSATTFSLLTLPQPFWSLLLEHDGHLLSQGLCIVTSFRSSFPQISAWLTPSLPLILCSDVTQPFPDHLI